jgi:hypothetical protein
MDLRTPSRSPRNSMRRRRIIGTAVAAFVAAATVLVAAAPAQALAPTTPDANTWGPDGRVRAILETPNAIYIGGKFTHLVSPTGATVARTNIAALDPTTGAPLPFAPAVNNLVYDIAISPDGNTLYVGGTFKKVGNVSRNHVAAMNPTTGALTSYNPNADLAVEAIVATSSRIYLGGDFTTIGGVSHPMIAATDLNGAVQTGFAVTGDNFVHDMKLTPDGSQLVVGGLFDALNGNTASRRLALVNPTSGAVTPFVDRVPYEIFDVETSSTQVFGAGAGGGGHTFAYSLTTRRQQWLALSNGDAHSVTLQNGVLYVGGHFTAFGGVTTSHVAALAPTDGKLLDWPIKVNSNLGVFITSAFNGHLSIGGDFTKINNKDKSHYARFSEVVDVTPPTKPGTPTATSTGTTTAHLTFGASSDDTVVNIVYNVFRDGGPNPVGEVTSSSTTTVSFDDSGMLPGSTHSWTVQASDGNNNSPMSNVSNTVTLDDPGFPVLTTMSMLDNNANGKVDQVELIFDRNVSCTAPCTSVWTLANVPSNGHLNTVSVSGHTVDLNLTEGSLAANTAVGAFTVALASSPNGVVDSGNHPAHFAATAPDDKAGPVPTDITSTAGATDNVMEDGDTFTVTFSEPVDPSSVHAANVKESDPVGPGNDTLIIVGLSDSSLDLGSDDYVTTDGGTIVFADATLTMLSGNTKIRSTIVGSCSGTACGATGPGANVPITFRPEPVLTDFAGNQATGSRTEVEGPY